MHAGPKTAVEEGILPGGARSFITQLIFQNP
ncbi:MAG: hypothetical protein CM15mP70_16730 [Pelagibacteraceae bacterium]|nr:MAG: hypothetical protein CM15mP70_16730 [Pelagibacteraceae bacterium]